MQQPAKSCVAQGAQSWSEGPPKTSRMYRWTRTDALLPGPGTTIGLLERTALLTLHQVDLAHSCEIQGLEITALASPGAAVAPALRAPKGCAPWTSAFGHERRAAGTTIEPAVGRCCATVSSGREAATAVAVAGEQPPNQPCAAATTRHVYR